MISEYYPKIAKGLMVAVVVVVMLFPHVIFELLFEMLHLLWELLVEFLDIAFEGIESTLDAVVEHLFETNLHSTQIIVFYIIFSIFLFFVYRVSRHVPGFVRLIKYKVMKSIEMRKIRLIVYWQSKSQVEKLKIIGIASLIISYYMFFAF